MKNLNKPQKNNKMNTTSVSNISKKTKQSVVSAVSDWALNNISSSLSSNQVNDIREVFESKQSDLQKIISSSIKEASSGKKSKDPDAPKRGKSSYIFFCLENREKIKKSNPDMSAKDIIKELGRLWRDTSVDKKEKYIEMSNNDKERYSGEISQYKPPDHFTTDKKTKRSGPKRSLTSYIFFCKEYRTLLKQQQPDLSTKDITSELGKQWKLLSDEQKVPYNLLANEDKYRYDSEKTSWNNNNNVVIESVSNKTLSTDNISELILKDKKSKKSSDKSKSLKDKKSKKSSSHKSKSLKDKKSKKSESSSKTQAGYILFCNEEGDSLKEENPKWSSQQLTKELKKAWKELSLDEQEEYNERSL